MGRRSGPVTAFGVGGLLPGLATALALVALPARAQDPLFAFAQLSDVQADDPIEEARFDQVLAAIAASGAPGSLLPHPVAVVFIAGDLVEIPQSVPQWTHFAERVDQQLTAAGIPFVAVPGNHDQNEFGPLLYEEYVADSGVWDVSSALLAGQNGAVATTGWRGLRFVGVNNSWVGTNTLRPSDLSQVSAIVSSAAASGENVLLMSHHPHYEESMPLAGILETPGLIGYMRGHKGTPHASQGLSEIANPVWDLSSESVMRDAALLYYEVFETEIRVYVLELVLSPGSLPAPAVIALAHPLTPATPSAPVAGFAALPNRGPAPLEVAFADLSSGDASAWLWDFGDGTTSTQRHPVHVYAVPGSYDVSLFASNALGDDTAVGLAAVRVATPPPSLGFTPVADARVDSSSPSQNFGSSSNLRARLATAIHQSYLRFDVSGLGEAPVSGAVLRLYVTDPSVEGGTLTVAPGGWDESTLTWENAPGVGSEVLDSLGVVFPETWVEFDVSALVTGEGSYDFGLSSASSNSVIFSSREGEHPPELVVSLAPPVPGLEPAAAAWLFAALGAAGACALARRRVR